MPSFKPGDWLGFTEMKPFSRMWSKLSLTDDDMQALQRLILCNPKGYPVIRGTGGLRKMRFSPVGAATGKRDAMRVCYAYFEDFSRVFLTVVYSKGSQDDLSDAERKKIRLALEQIEKELRRP